MDYDEDRELIQEVEQHPILWDNRRKDYKKQQQKDVAWLLISGKLNKDVKELVYSWGKLRRKYGRRKTQLRSGDGVEDLDSAWPYMSQLAFLKPVFKHRKTSGSQFPIRGNSKNSKASGCLPAASVSSATSNSEYEVLEVHHTQVSEMESELETSLIGSQFPDVPCNRESTSCIDEREPQSATAQAPSGNKKRKRRAEFEDNFLALLKEGNGAVSQPLLENSCECDMDEDRLFLLSLLSDFKELPGNKKLEAKIKILQVFVDLKK